MPSPPRNRPDADRGDDRAPAPAQHHRRAVRCVVLAGVVIVASATGCGSSGPAAPPLTGSGGGSSGPGLPAPAVVTKPAIDPFIGVVSSRGAKVVTAEFDGKVEKVLVKEGQAVNVGDPLLVLDKRDVERQFEAAKQQEAVALAQLAEARTAASTASRGLSQAREMEAGGAGSRSAVKDAQAAASAAYSRVSAAEAGLASVRIGLARAGELLGNSTLAAPIAGVVSIVTVQEGQMAGRGMPVARIFDPDQLIVRFAVPQTLREEVQLEDTVDVTFEDKPGAPLVAVVKNVNRTLEPPLDFDVADADLEVGPSTDRRALIGGKALVSVRR
ncbi:MAG: efflux RND transporter periplasmic adaptor subunit [Kofleriaceae bacterium]|nr:efflux RND transporter periplasmic adaptor subunit [Kofleriaceae bacterium]MBP6839901.1 efflux RND transporter periplasmic adaptor subunit [Kofleriaceae bacterium]